MHEVRAALTFPLAQRMWIQIDARDGEVAGNDSADWKPGTYLQFVIIF